MSEREERAFRAAFEQHAEEFEPARLSPPYGPRRDWGMLVAVAVAVVIVLFAGVAVFAGVTQRNGNATASSGVASGPGQASGLLSRLPAAPTGWKWVSQRNAAVLVPDSWGWGGWPANAWPCGAGDRSPIASGPFVASDDTFANYATPACAPPRGTPVPARPAAGFPQVSSRAWQPTLHFGRVASRTATYDGWTLVSKPVGVTGVTVIVPTSERALGKRILDSARTFTVDQNGCTATSPVQAEHVVRPPAGQSTPAGEPTGASICQYARVADHVTPGLMGSRRLDAADARALARAIAAAPRGSGPNYPGDCLDPTSGDQAIVVRMHYASGTVDSYVYVEGCAANGIDDGRTVHRITAADCRPLYAADPIRITGAHMGIFQLCAGAN